MYISESLQEKYFLDLIKSKQPVVIYLRSGKKYEGTVVSVSQDLLFLNTPLLQTICRSQILTIIPLTQ